MTYAEKLRDPRWQKKRLEIFERDGFTCTDCGSKDKTLNVHHYTYLPNNEPWDYDNSYLTTLCEGCHKRFSEQQKGTEKVIIENIRLKLTDTFIKNCASELFRDTENLNDLIYILWELKQNGGDIIAILQSISRIRETGFWIGFNSPNKPKPEPQWHASEL